MRPNTQNFRQVVFAFAALVVAAFAAPSHAKLVHLWSFDGDLTDGSGNGNTGTFTGSDGGYVAGAFGQGISLAAGDAVDNLAGVLGGADDANHDITLNVWLKIDAPLPSLAYLGGIGDRADSGLGAERAFLTFEGTDANNFYFWGSNKDAATVAEWNADGQWHMYTWVLDFDGAGNVTFSAYIDGDGAFYPPVTVARTYAATNNVIGVGGTSTWAVDWTGAVDEFSIWDSALTASQVGELFNTNAVVPAPAALPAGLIAMALVASRRRRRA